MITKEEALENIKARLGKAQKISDRTILETVEPLLAIATEEMTIDAYVDMIYPGIISVNTNFTKETTDFIKNYKPEPKDPPKDEPNVSSTVVNPIAESSEVKEMLEYYRVQKENEAREAKKQSVYALATKDLRDDERKRFEAFFKTQPIEVDVDEETFAQSILKSYTQFTKDFIGEETYPYVSGGNPTRENAIISQAAEQWRKQNKIETKI